MCNYITAKKEKSKLKECVIWFHGILKKKGLIWFIIRIQSQKNLFHRWLKINTTPELLFLQSCRGLRKNLILSFNLIEEVGKKYWWFSCSWVPERNPWILFTPDSVLSRPSSLMPKFVIFSFCHHFVII